MITRNLPMNPRKGGTPININKLIAPNREIPKFLILLLPKNLQEYMKKTKETE